MKGSWDTSTASNDRNSEGEEQERGGAMVARLRLVRTQGSGQACCCRRQTRSRGTEQEL